MLFTRLMPVRVAPALVAEVRPSLPRSKWDDASTVPPIPWRYHNWRVDWKRFLFGPPELNDFPYRKNP